MADPLILTLDLDPAAQGRFEAERRAHFPAHLNRIPAHVTLFHHLPGAQEDAVAQVIAAACGAQAPVPVRVVDVFPLGRGVAYRLAAPEVAALREGLARAWAAWLTPQDRQPWRPHVTVQNKVAPEVARATLARLRAAFSPFAATAAGLRLWRYRGGPWEEVGGFPFTGAEPAGPPLRAQP